MSLEIILLVDDEATERENLRQILLGEGYSVLAAETYQDALIVFDRHRGSVGLLVADISLPGGNGCELAITLRSQKPNLRVLFVSGHVGAEVCQYYGLDVSDEHFLRKPFSAADLLSRVTQVLNSADAFPRLCEPPKPKTRTAG